jgi:hypothetical protein
MRIASRQLGHHHGTVNDCLAERDDLVYKCYHGSSCIDASNKFGLLDRYCDCDSAEALVAGLMCQYEATSICIKDQNVEQVTDQYCVNGGQCIALVGTGDSHPGCICEIDTWEGKHCEFSHGLLLDDALDLFQQRKGEIAFEQSMDGGSGDLMTGTLGDEGEKSAIPLFFIMGTVISVLAVIPLSTIAIRMSRKRQQQVKDNGDYQSIGHDSSTSIKGFFLPPPDVFLSSRKKEVAPNDESSLMLAPGTPGIDIREDVTGDVEMLDAETSRMIEAQFASCDVDCDKESHRLDLSDQDTGTESLFAPSYDSDNKDINLDSGFRSRRIAINCGNPLKLQVSANADGNRLVDDDDISDKNEVSGLVEPMNRRCNVGGVKSSDGDYFVDSDEDTYFV